jgi:hypothetical protein
MIWSKKRILEIKVKYNGDDSYSVEVYDLWLETIVTVNVKAESEYQAVQRAFADDAMIELLGGE